MTFKKSVRTAKKTPHFTVTKINLLTLFKEIIAVYCENNTRTYKRIRNAQLMSVKQVVHAVTNGIQGIKKGMTKSTGSQLTVLTSLLH
jgi:hypothetical protein